MGRADRRGMKLLLLFNTILIPAPFFAGQRSALLTESIIGWPVVVDHQVELSWPLRTLWTEMPRLTTSMRSVFHGSTAFPEFAYEKSLVCSESQSRGEQIKYRDQALPAKLLNVFADAELLNVIWQNLRKLIFGIRDTT